MSGKIPRMACCSWLEFITSVRRLWKPEWGEIDHAKAREAWSRYAASGAEFVRHQQRELGLS